MAKPIVCNLFNSLNTPRLNTEMGKPIFFDLGIGIIGFFCFAFRYRYFTVFRYFGKMSVPITTECGLALGLLPTLPTSWPFHCEAQSELAELASVGQVRGTTKFSIIFY